MEAKFLGLISFEKAVQMQESALAQVQAGQGDIVLGFELEPTITLGARGGEQDLLWLESQWRERGYKIVQADRGGQATLHNPGQLVIFPTVDVRSMGVRKFVCLLSDVTREFLRAHGCVAKWDSNDPGLYTPKGKIMSVGLRVRAGITTHGIAINVHNDVAAFQGIRVCGRAGAAVDRLRTDIPLSELFLSWAREFTVQLTRAAFSPNLGAGSDMRL